MKISKYKDKENKKLKLRAYDLYRNGLSSRDVGDIVGRSHEWVLSAVKEIENGAVHNSRG